MRPDELMVPASEVRELSPAEISAALEEDPEVTAISDYLAGALDPVQSAAVKARLEDDAAFRRRVEPVMRAWAAWPGPTDFVPDDGATAARWERVLARAEWRHDGAEPRDPAPASDADGGRPAVGARRLRRWQLAAGMALAVGMPLAGWAGAWLWPRLTAPRVLVAEAPPRDSRVVVVGNDSWVSLAPGARLTWPDRADERGVRELVLDGNASFTLQRVTAGHYVVVTPAARVVVTGTRFDVTMPDPSTTLVAVQEGRVLLEARGAPPTMTPLPLGPGEQGRAVWGLLPRRAR